MPFQKAVAILQNIHRNKNSKPIENCHNNTYSFPHFDLKYGMLTDLMCVCLCLCVYAYIMLCPS